MKPLNCGLSKQSSNAKTSPSLTLLPRLSNTKTGPETELCETIEKQSWLYGFLKTHPVLYSLAFWHFLTFVYFPVLAVLELALKANTAYLYSLLRFFNY